MSRSSRIARALTIGYGYQLAVALTGLAITPLLLTHLGDADFGRWLIAGQVLALLGLLDLGVTAVLPREVARASGAANGTLVEVVQRAWWLVWLQTPFVAIVATGVWIGVSASWPDLAEPLAVVLSVFVFQFPLRFYGAVLVGLQDLSFCAGATAAGWAATTTISVMLVFSGWGLLALAAGWAAGQLLVCVITGWRLWFKFPLARPVGGWPGRVALASMIVPSLWTSLRQFVQLLLNGAELIILGWLEGPAAVVIYACSVKLIALVNNQPYLIATAAMPAIAELAVSGTKEQLWRAVRAVGLGVLLLSGALAVAVMAANAAFVTAWVGGGRFAGPEVTLLATLAMLARHWYFNLGQTMYALGAERLLTAAAVADGLLTTAATAGWVLVLGPVGVPLGSLTGVCLTNAPLAVLWLARAAGLSTIKVLGWTGPWVMRSAIVLLTISVVSFTPVAADSLVGTVLLIVGLVCYAALVYPILWKEPLSGYTQRATAAFALRFRRTRAGT